MTQILYKIGNDVSIDEFVELLKMSTLAERRPIHNQAVMEAMLEHAGLYILHFGIAPVSGFDVTIAFINIE
jgi:hypothetical protein